MDLTEQKFPQVPLSFGLVVHYLGALGFEHSAMYPFLVILYSLDMFNLVQTETW